jgi:dCTP deaminase
MTGQPGAAAIGGSGAAGGSGSAVVQAANAASAHIERPLRMFALPFRFVAEGRIVDRARAASALRIATEGENSGASLARRPAFGNHDSMAILSDKWIREHATQHGMIEPFVEAQKREGVISYGLSSYGYDARVSDEFKIFTNVDNAVVDPKDFSATSFVDRQTDVCVIPPNSFALARTVEFFRIPRDVLVICLGKSTYARCGIIVNVTPLEPEWEGHVTLEFSNTTPLPAKIYANEGACQFLFLQGNEPCETSYADRAGKYMGQQGVTLPKL